MRAARNWLAGVCALGAGGILVAVLAGCGVGSSQADTSLANGKQLFVARCGTCHVLSRAGTKGVVGPNLDQAFQQALKDGIRRSTIRGLVREQIDHPIPGSGMPADVVKGQNARDVAAYVSSVAAARARTPACSPRSASSRRRAASRPRAARWRSTRRRPAWPTSPRTPRRPRAS